MSERVTIIRNSSPVVLTCPHGFDDTNTSILTKKCAKELGASAVINNGWRRSKKVDEINSFADCNKVNHVMKAKNFVVNDEYGREFMKLCGKALQKYQYCYVFHIHGVGNHVKQLTSKKDVHFILGYGGSPESCNPWIVDVLSFNISTHGMGQIKVCHGDPDGNYSGKSKNNMNQWFRQHRFSPQVQSLQIEITYDLRETENIANKAGIFLAKCLKSIDIKNQNFKSNHKYEKI